MGVRLAHVCFESDDLDKTEAFYNILGIERRFEFRNLQDELVGYYLAFDNQTYIEVIKTARLAKPGLIRHFAIEVDNVDDVYDALKSEMRDRAGRTSVPQIFIDGQHIGGFDDIAALDSVGELDPLLFGEDVPYAA